MPESARENPFASSGAIVVGDRFVGRRRELRRLASHSLSADPGSSAITGLPKIGKSSLAWNLLFNELEPLPKHIIPAWVNLARCTNLVDMLRRLAEEVRGGLARLDPSLRPREMDRVAHEKLDAAEIEELTRGYLSQVRAAGLRVVAVIDEFDAARSVFGDDCEGAFRALRDLAYDPRWRLAWITVSRRSLRQIVRLSGATDSPFPNVVTRKIELSCFTPSEQGELIAIGNVSNLPLLHHVVPDLTGGHPHLATVLLRCVCDLAMEAEEAGVTSVLREEEWLEAISGEFIDYYDDLIELLRQEDSLKTLVEILFGPVFTATRYDADRLRRQGLLKTDPKTDEFQTFSTDFDAYLGVIAREENLWPLWTQTERLLRDNLRRILVDHLGEDWPTVLPAKAPQLAKAADRWTELWLREKRRFGALAVGDILDYTNPLDLLQIMYNFWRDIQPLLGGKTKAYWELRFQLLAQVRNPLAHSRPVDKKRILDAEEYCRELLDLLAAPRIAEGN